MILAFELDKHKSLWYAVADRIRVRTAAGMKLEKAEDMKAEILIGWKLTYNQYPLRSCYACKHAVRIEEYINDGRREGRECQYCPFGRYWCGKNTEYAQLQRAVWASNEVGWEPVKKKLKEEAYELALRIAEKEVVRR